MELDFYEKQFFHKNWNFKTFSIRTIPEELLKFIETGIF